MKHPLTAFSLLLLTAAVQNANALVNPMNDFATMTRSEGSITINVLSNDTSTDDRNLGSETFKADIFILSVDTRSEGYGSIVKNANNTLTYTPADGFIGTDKFEYFATDSSSGYGSIAQVTVQVNADTPVVITPPTIDSLALKVTGKRNKSVAAALDAACYLNDEEGRNLALTYAAGGEGGGELTEFGSACEDLYAAINSSTDLIDDLIADISPDETLIQRQLLAENAFNKTSRIYNNLVQMRTQESAASISINNINLPSGGAAGGELGSPWTLLSSIQIENLERERTLEDAGYNSDARGLMLGLGYRLSNNVNLGAALDWTNYEVNYVQQGGDLDSKVYGLTGFFTWYQGPLSLDLQAGYSLGHSQSQRRFTVAANTYANSSYDSNQYNLSSQLEWSWQTGSLAVRPYLRLDYLMSHVDGFSETGNSAWKISAGRQTQEQTNASIGLNTSYAMNFSWGVMIPSVKISAVTQDSLNKDPVAFELVNANSELGSFNLDAASLDKQYYKWEMGAAIVLTNGISTFISGSSVSDNNHISAYQLSGGINIEF